MITRFHRRINEQSIAYYVHKKIAESDNFQIESISTSCLNSIVLYMLIKHCKILTTKLIHTPFYYTILNLNSTVLENTVTTILTFNNVNHILKSQQIDINFNWKKKAEWFQTIGPFLCLTSSSFGNLQRTNLTPIYLLFINESHAKTLFAGNLTQVAKFAQIHMKKFRNTIINYSRLHLRIRTTLDDRKLRYLRL